MKFEVEVGMYQGSVLSSFLIAVEVDFVTEYTREVVLHEFLYVDEIVLMSDDELTDSGISS